MSYTTETLYNLLPAIYRIRDAEIGAALPEPLSTAEQAELATLAEEAHPTPQQLARLIELRQKQARPREPLKALLHLFAEQFAVVEENLDQLYDDLFIETCAGWVVPYLGDLLGYQPLHALGRGGNPARAEVAHTIALRRRKGTAAVLEQLAYDVTGWKARCVEYFQLLAATQYMNHPRPQCRYSPDLRKWQELRRLASPFTSTARTVEVRRIDSSRGRFNIPNIGLHLWRIAAYPHSRSPALRLDDRRYVISPLGHEMVLYTRPKRENDITHLAEPINVPEPISRRTMAGQLPLYYGFRRDGGGDIDNPEPSVVLYVDGTEIPRSQVAVCNLEDVGGAWAHEAPVGKYAIDPELGRVAVAADLQVPESVRVTYQYGFPADLGGGEYGREREALAPEVTVRRVPTEHATIAEALVALAGSGVVEIVDSGRYEETLNITVQAGGHIILRSGEQCRPTIVLFGDMEVRGGEQSSFTLDGVLLSGGRMQVPAGGDLARINLCHATLVPGLALDATGKPTSADAPSLVVEKDGVTVTLEKSIVGGLRIAAGCVVSGSGSIVDATAADGLAYGAPQHDDHGAPLSLETCTVIGRIRARAVGMISNSILLARRRKADPLPAVHIERRQVGCVRFSWLPGDSLVPRRHRCQPQDGAGEGATAPHFTTLHYGTAAYCQLARSTFEAIRRGADDESEMGAYHHLYPAQREANLRIRLQEFLRAGLAAGIFYES
jgi:hypothetical protein